MTWLTLAARNVRHQARQYTAFFLSSAFAVWMFFLFVGLQYHPDIERELTTLQAATTFQVVAGLVAGFSVLFIFYASSAFLKTRKRELGTFALLGMLPRQVAGILYAENLLIGLGAIAVGVGSGVLCNKLFFLLVGRVLRLEQPVPFHLSLTAVTLTVLLFTGVFLLVSVLNHVSLRRLSVAEVFRSATRPRTPPRFSWWLAGLSVAGLGAAYTLFLMPGDWKESEPRFWPGIILTLISTYLLFQQGTSGALQLLRRRESLYYRHTTLLTVAQMLPKVRDNARVLFMVSFLTTLVLVPLSVAAVNLAFTAETAVRFAPVGLTVEQKPGELMHEQALSSLQEHGVSVADQAMLPLLPGVMVVGGANRSLFEGAVAPASAVNQWLGLIPGETPLVVPPGQAVLIKDGTPVLPSTPISLALGDEALANPMQMKPQTTLSVARSEDRSFMSSLGRHHTLAVVDDAVFADLWARFGTAYGHEMHGFRLDEWMNSGPVFDALYEAEVPALGTYLNYREAMNEVYIGLFVLGFVGFLFFLASGQMLYFKLFTDLAAERQHYQALFRVGLQVRELRRTVSVQALVLFFAPLLIALANSLAFLHMLARIENSATGVAPFASVAGTYLLLFGAYFLAARRTYVRALLPAVVSGRGQAA